MAAIRKALIVPLLLMLWLSFNPGVAAIQPAYASPYGYLHDIPYFATDLVPGELVSVGVWLETLPSEPTTTIRYDGEFGSVVVGSELTVYGHSFNTIDHTISAETIMAECVDGVIQVNERILQQDNAGNFTILVSKRANSAPCSWASNEVSPIAPIQTFVCGPNNDRISLQIQPEHVNLTHDSNWDSHQRTIRYEAAPGYVLVGSGEFRFRDEPNRLCVSPRPTPPVIVLPPPTPPRPPLIPTPRTWPTPRVTIVPLPTPVEIWTPSPYPPGPTPTPVARPRIPVPIQPTPGEFPTPRVTIVPQVTPTPVMQHGVPNEGSGPAAMRKVVMMALGPASLIVGGIAMNIRRFD